MGEVLHFRDGAGRAYCEVLFADGGRLHVALDGNGFAIRRIGATGEPGAILFSAGAGSASAILGGLAPDDNDLVVAPLQILARTLSGFGRLDDVGPAFEQAARAVANSPKDVSWSDSLSLADRARNFLIEAGITLVIWFGILILLFVTLGFGLNFFAHLTGADHQAANSTVASEVPSPVSQSPQEALPKVDPASIRINLDVYGSFALEKPGSVRVNASLRNMNPVPVRIHVGQYVLEIGGQIVRDIDNAMETCQTPKDGDCIVGPYRGWNIGSRPFATPFSPTPGSLEIDYSYGLTGGEMLRHARKQITLSSDGASVAETTVQQSDDAIPSPKTP